MPELWQFAPDPETVAEALLKDGAVIAEGVVPPGLVDRVLSDLRAPFDEQGSSSPTTSTATRRGVWAAF